MAGPAQEMFAADRASRGLGMELLSAGDGAATVRMTVADTMVNGHGIAHGGFLFLLADSAFACACNSRGPVTVASGADIDFVAPARLGDTLTATAAERGRFGRSGIYDVTVRRGDHVIAEFRGRSRVLRPTTPTAAPLDAAPEPLAAPDVPATPDVAPVAPPGTPAASDAGPEAPPGIPAVPDGTVPGRVDGAAS